MQQFRVSFLDTVVYEPQLWLTRHCKPFHQFGQQFLPMDFAMHVDVNLQVRQIKPWLQFSCFFVGWKLCSGLCQIVMIMFICCSSWLLDYLGSMPLVYEKLFVAVAFKIQLFSISERNKDWIVLFRFMLILILIFTEKLKGVKNNIFQEKLSSLFSFFLPCHFGMVGW